MAAIHPEPSLRPCGRAASRSSASRASRAGSSRSASSPQPRRRGTPGDPPRRHGRLALQGEVEPRFLCREVRQPDRALLVAHLAPRSGEGGRLELPLAAYIAYCRDGDLTQPPPGRGRWGRRGAAAGRRDAVLASRTSRPEFAPLLEDFDLDVYFLDNLQARLRGDWKRFIFFCPFTNLFIGGAGTCISLHKDYWSSQTSSPSSPGGSTPSSSARRRRGPPQRQARAARSAPRRCGGLSGLRARHALRGLPGAGRDAVHAAELVTTTCWGCRRPCRWPSTSSPCTISATTCRTCCPIRCSSSTPCWAPHPAPGGSRRRRQAARRGPLSQPAKTT